MVSAVNKPQTKPSVTLLKQLERIGEIKENLGKSGYQACGALGLQVRLASDDARSPGSGYGRHTKKNGFRRIKATVGPDLLLDAFTKDNSSENWTVLSYEPGAWEYLCQPTLHLCQWLQEWGGLHPEMQLTFQIALENFQRTRVMSLPLRQQSGGRLCGRCGDEVQDLAGHIYEMHDQPKAPMPLVVYLKIRYGRKSIMAVQAKGREQYIWTVPEEYYRAELNAPGFQLGLANDIERIFSVSGKSRLRAVTGRYPLPNDATPLPYLANVLRKLTRGGGHFY